MVVASDYDDEHRMLKKQMVTNLLGPNPQVTSVSDDVEKDGFYESKIPQYEISSQKYKNRILCGRRSIL
jgi:hypothetical protein